VLTSRQPVIVTRAGRTASVEGDGGECNGSGAGGLDRRRARRDVASGAFRVFARARCRPRTSSARAGPVGWGQYALPRHRRPQCTCRPFLRSSSIACGPVTKRSLKMRSLLP
jgi:hypothetical protein